MLDTNDDRVRDSESGLNIELYDKSLWFIQSLTNQMNIPGQRVPPTFVKEKEG